MKVHIRGELSTKKIRPTIKTEHYVKTVYQVDEEIEVNYPSEAKIKILDRLDPELGLVWDWYEINGDVLNEVMVDEIK